MPSEYTPDQVRIVDFPATRVAALEHRGDPRRIGNSIRKFVEWRRENRLHPDRNATFNVLYTDEYGIRPDEFRFEICAATEREIAANDYGVVAKTLPAGRCAVLRHVGSDATLRAAIAYLYSDWLPGSGEEDAKGYKRNTSTRKGAPSSSSTLSLLALLGVLGALGESLFSCLFLSFSAGGRAGLRRRARGACRASL